MRKTCSAFAFTLALFAFGHFRVFGPGVRWDVPSLNWLFHGRNFMLDG